MIKIYTNAIIGSSISSTGLLLSKKFNNEQNCIIDAGEMFKKKFKGTKEKDLFKHHISKFKKGQNHTGKDFSKIFQSENINKLNISNSYMFGGYSNTWGAYSCNYSNNELIDIGIDPNLDFSETDKALNLNNINSFNQKGKKIFDTKYNDLDEIDTLLAINKKCKPCGSCLYGCPKNYIFNTRDLFRDLTKQITIYNNFLLNKITREDDIYKLELISTKNQKIKIIYAKKIFFGSGPINTLKILLKSFPEIQKIYLKDSQSFYWPIIEKRIPNLDIEDNRIELTNKSFKMNLMNSSARIQVYHFGKFLRNHIKRILGINTNLLNFIFSTSHILLVFFPSDKSSLGSFSYKNKKIYFKIERDIDNKFIKTIIDKTISSLKSKFFISKFFIKRRKIYESYHYGAISIQIKNKIYYPNTKTGLINHENLKNIFLIDGSVLKNMPSGPISRILMANAMNIGRNQIA